MSGKLLLVYLASSETIGFSRKSFFLLVSQEKTITSFNFSALCCFISKDIAPLPGTPSCSPFSYKELKTKGKEEEEEEEEERAGDGLVIVHIHQPPPCWEKGGGSTRAQ